MVPRKLQGMKNVSLNYEGLIDYERKGNLYLIKAEVTSVTEDLPKTDMWAIPGPAGIPQGKEVDVSNPAARYIDRARRHEQFIGLVSRTTDGDGDIICAAKYGGRQLILFYSPDSRERIASLSQLALKMLPEEYADAKSAFEENKMVIPTPLREVLEKIFRDRAQQE